MSRSAGTSRACSRDGVGSTATYERQRRATIELPDGLELAAPIAGPGPADTDEPRDPGRCPPVDGARRRVRPLPAAADHADRGRPRGGVPAVDRPGDRPRRSTAPTSPTALRLTDHHELDLEPSVSRRDLARRADRAARPTGLPGPVRRSAACRSTRASTTTRTTTSTRGWRRCRRSGRTTRSRRADDGPVSR